MTVLKRNSSTLALANCLMLLSRVGQSTGPTGDKLFTCKTCDRKFPSFQALGGHRASHKKPRLGDPNDRSPVKKQKRPHECSVCGKEFAIGQALGGHMRRHRAAEKGDDVVLKPVMMKRSGSGSKRVLSLDLNLTPFENDVKSRESALPSWLNLGVVS